VNRTQIIFIVSAISLTMVLYFAPKTNSNAVEMPAASVPSNETVFPKIDTSDVDGKINLAEWLVDSSAQPMKGIMMLREVLAKDENNIKALLSLGRFAVKSGQYDKAIERFEKVLTLNSDYDEAYLYLGDVYESKGDKENAIKYYQKYKSATNNPSAAAEIDKYINQLKN